MAKRKNKSIPQEKAALKGPKAGTVYIVHHIDTEGPLSEPLAETFKRVENMLGITIRAERTEANLERLQKGELVGADPATIAAVKRFLDPSLMKLNRNWKEVDAMLEKVMGRRFREEMRDSFGGGWVFNWHIMDHAGFETNERGRALGYLEVFDHYEDMIRKTEFSEDGVHWHFHPISFFKEAHISATSYENSYPEIHQILARRLTEKAWFPRVNRAGFHSERPDSNWFLEQWIPFDPSNQAIREGKHAPKETENGRFADWTGAPDDWSLYHPDFYDWRKKGKLNRVIARSLNMKARYRNISVQEIEKAFSKAEKGENVYLGITNHDYRDMDPEIGEFREMLAKAAAKFPAVQFKFSEAVEAFRAVLGYGQAEVRKARIDFDVRLDDGLLSVKIKNGEPFGPQPYLAIKTKAGEYFHDNFDFGDFKREYFYAFDRYTIPVEAIDTIAVACNDRFGNSCIGRITFKGAKPLIETIFLA